MKFKLLTRPQGRVLGKYAESKSRVSFIMGPLGSGKTFMSCEKIFKIMCNQAPNQQNVRKTRGYAIRNTYSELNTTTIKDWLELFGELGKFTAGGQHPPVHRLHFRLPDRTTVKAELIFLALDRPQNIKRLRGSQATLFWLNEAKELPKAIVDMCDLRHGRYPSMMDGGPTWHGMIGDYNAPEEDSWIYEIAEVTKPKGWKFFKQPGGLTKEYIEDEHGKLSWTGEWLPNPEAENLDNLPGGIDYYVTGLEGKSEAWIDVNLANNYGVVMEGKAIYAEQWADSLHVSDSIKLIEDHPIIIGMDFGLTPAAIIGQETPNGVVHILDEVIGNGMGIKQFVKNALKPKLNEKYKSCEWNFVGDPAGNRRADTDEETVFKVLYEEFDFDVDAANTNDPVIRWEAVREYLQQLRDGKPAFRLHPRCKMLRKGFNGGYNFRRLQVVGEERFVDKATKNKYSHPHDGLQYLMMWVNGDTKPSIEFERADEYAY